jgi:hypothetical protein
MGKNKRKNAIPKYRSTSDVKTMEDLPDDAMRLILAKVLRKAPGKVRKKLTERKKALTGNLTSPTRANLLEISAPPFTPPPSPVPPFSLPVTHTHPAVNPHSLYTRSPIQPHAVVISYDSQRGDTHRRKFTVGPVSLARVSALQTIVYPIRAPTYSLSFLLVSMNN